MAGQYKALEIFNVFMINTILNKDIEKLMLKEIAGYKASAKAENVTRTCHDYNIL